MMRCLFVCVSILDQVSFIIGSSGKANPRGEIIRCKSRRHDNRRDENQKRVQMGRAFLIDERRVNAVVYQRRLVLYRLMHDRIQAMISHHFERIRHQLILRLEMFVVADRVGILLEAIFRPRRVGQIFSELLRPERQSTVQIP